LVPHRNLYAIAMELAEGIGYSGVQRPPP